MTISLSLFMMMVITAVSSPISLITSKRLTNITAVIHAAIMSDDSCPSSACFQQLTIVKSLIF